VSLTAKTGYISLVEATNYFSGRLETAAWDRSTPSNRSKALIQASTDLDKLQFIGEKVDMAQEHEFPRTLVGYIVENVLTDNDLVPFIVKYAVCEQALALLSGFNVNKEIDGLFVSSSGYGTVKTTYDRKSVPMHLKSGLCAQAYQFLLPVLRDQGNVVFGRV